MLGIVTSTGYWWRLLRVRGLQGGRFAVWATVAFLGLVLIVTMTAHCLDVLSRLVIGTGHDGKVFVYDFRAYSLLLLGIVLIACGLRLLRISLGTGAGPSRTVTAVVILVASLTPIQPFFAIPLTVLSGAVLLLALWRAEPALGGR